LNNATGYPRHREFVTLLGLSCVAFFIAMVPARAQTYYYYPPSGPSASSGATTPAAVPTYVWRWGFRRRVTWTQPATQYYYYPAASAPQGSSQPESPGQSASTASAEESAPASTVTANAAPTAAEVAAAGNRESTDPYGFTSWLNTTRAAYGLAPVGYDPNLSSWAAVNNGYQAQRGMGHFVMGPSRRQNSAMGAFPGIEAMWMASPAHRAALLDPTIRWIGIAGLGAYWTFNAN
jgi:uncharacterized protein YkwD